MDGRSQGSEAGDGGGVRRDMKSGNEKGPICPQNKSSAHLTYPMSRAPAHPPNDSSACGTRTYLQ